MTPVIQIRVEICRQVCRAGQNVQHADGNRRYESFKSSRIDGLNACASEGVTSPTQAVSGTNVDLKNGDAALGRPPRYSFDNDLNRQHMSYKSTRVRTAASLNGTLAMIQSDFLFYPSALGAVGQVHARDDPAVRRHLAAPQRPVEAPSLRALRDLQASRAADLVDQPQAAPLVLFQNRTQQDARGIRADLRVVVVVQSSIHGDEMACSGGENEVNAEKC